MEKKRPVDEIEDVVFVTSARVISVSAIMLSLKIYVAFSCSIAESPEQLDMYVFGIPQHQGYEAKASPCSAPVSRKLPYLYNIDLE